jgi:ligand-binding sensor domain-containing protein
MQDPDTRTTVFAGTTEGLFRTNDAGTNWMRTTGADVIVNDVYVDPANTKHVLLATDRGGVLASFDGGTSFEASNKGFSTRLVTAFAQDRTHPSDLYLGVVNNKEWGGAFISHDGGLSWSQREQGLEGRDVFSLAESINGTVVAGTENGVFWYDQNDQVWKRTGAIGAAMVEHSRRPVHGKSAAGRAPAKSAPVKAASVKTGRQIEGIVTSLTLVGNELFATTSEGVFETENPTGVWTPVTGLGPNAEGWRYAASARGVVMLANLGEMTVSVDGGRKWHGVSLPSGLTQVGAIAVDDEGELWVGGRQGVFVSTDGGTTWTTLKNLYASDVNSLYFDAKGQRMLVTANASTTMAFVVHLPTKTVNYWDTGWHLRFMRPVGDYMVGATLYDGVVLQPRMVDSKDVASH